MSSTTRYSQVTTQNPAIGNRQSAPTTTHTHNNNNSTRQTRDSKRRKNFVQKLFHGFIGSLATICRNPSEGATTKQQINPPHTLFRRDKYRSTVTMDSVLLSTVVVVTAYLSRNVPTPVKQNSSVLLYVRVSFALSLTLLALGVMDVTPSSWNIMILTDDHDHNDDDNNDARPTPWIIAQSTAYRVVLLAIAMQVILWGPIRIGSCIAQDVYLQWRAASWLPRLWMIQMMIFFLRQALFRLILPIIYMLRRACRRRRYQPRSESLPIHSNHGTKHPGGGGGGISGSSSSSSISGNGWFCYLLTRYSLQAVGGCVGVGTVLTALYCIGSPVVITDDNASVLTRCIAALSAIGILLSSVLNGFGSVSMPYHSLRGRYLQEVHPDAISAAEIELDKARSALNDRKAELHASRPIYVPRGPPTSLPQQQQQHGGLPEWSGDLNTTSGGGHAGNGNSSHNRNNIEQQRRRKIQNEINFLESLVGELADDVSEMKDARTIAARARTRMGRFQSMVGVAFSLILIARLGCSFWFLTIASPLQGTDANADLVTEAMVWLMGRGWVDPEHRNTLSELISLCLTAVLSFTQVRFFLKTVNILYRRATNWCYCYHCVKQVRSMDQANNGDRPFHSLVSEVVIPHMMSSMLSCYCLAASILTKNMLPGQYRSSFSQALDTTHFSTRMYPVHITFVTSALISTTILGILVSIQRQNTYRYKLGVDVREERRGVLLDP